MYTTSLLVLLFAVASNAFIVNIGKWRSPSAMMATLPDSVKRGDSDVIRNRLKKMGEAKRQAAGILAPHKKELAAELEEMADEIDETTEEYVKFATLAAICAKNGMKLNKADMPEPVDDDDSEPSTLRLRKDLEDMTLRYNKMANVKRAAANEIKCQVSSGGCAPKNLELAIAMEEDADEIEMVSGVFVEVTQTMQAQEDTEKAVLKGIE